MKKLVVMIVLGALFASQAVSDSPDKTQSEFVFARVQFNMDARWIFETLELPWHHDHPTAEDLYLTMVRDVTGIQTTPDSFQVVQLDSEDIFKYPMLYFSEPGFMDMTPKEATNFREYLNRGGFAMFDDFRGRDLDNLRLQMRKVFPNREMSKLDLSHPVFHTFYEIDSLVMDPPYYDSRFLGGKAEFWGMSDESGRLILVANQNNDLGEFWQWVDEGHLDFKLAAQSVRFGINYLVYAMTH
jgi:hypothetical protein